MDITVSAVRAGEADLPWSLRDSLASDPVLRGRARLEMGVPEPGTMGALTSVLIVTLGPGGVGAAFAAAFIVWVRQRRGTARYRVTRPDGSTLELTAERIRGLDVEALRVQVADLARFLEEGGEVTGGDAPTVGDLRRPSSG